MVVEAPPVRVGQRRVRPCALAFLVVCNLLVFVRLGGVPIEAYTDDSRRARWPRKRPEAFELAHGALGELPRGRYSA